MRTVFFSFPAILIYGLFIQIAFLFPLWDSPVPPEDAVFLGRFSTGYFAVILLNIALIAVYSIAVLLRKRIEIVVTRIPSGVKYAVLLIAAILLIFAWTTSLNIRFLHYLSVNWLLLAFLLIRTLPDVSVQRKWLWAGVLVVAVFSLPMFWTAITDKGSFAVHDEAIWADVSTSYFRDGGVHFRSFLQDYPVRPGYGVASIGYGWLLENIAFDARIGRIWTQVAYLLGFLGIGLVAKHLYGLKVALVSVGVALLSQHFVPINEFRGHHQIPALMMFCLYFMLMGYSAKRFGWIWHLACGLLATFSLQFHAIGLVIALTFSAHYALAFVYRFYQDRRVQMIVPTLAFGMGALGGVLFHYAFNVAPLGGYSVYLDLLSKDRPSFGFQLDLFKLQLFGPARLYGRADPVFALLSWAGLTYMLWRRNRPDKIFGSFLIVLIVIIYFFDNYGYPVLYTSALSIVIGVLLVEGFTALESRTQFSKRSALLSACALFVLATPFMTRWIHWESIGNFVRSGEVPYPYDPFIEISEILQRDYLLEDDVFASTHQVLWGMPDTENLVSIASEQYWVKIGGDEFVRNFWESAAPDVYIAINDSLGNDSVSLELINGLLDYINRNNFELCDGFDVEPYHIDVYRADCSLIGS